MWRFGYRRKESILSNSTIRIEDDDGFVTEWPWPDDRLMLANGDFVAMYEALHDAQRVAGGSDEEA